MTGGAVRLELPAQPEFVSVARLTLAGVASRIGFDYDGVEDVRLAVAEAMTLLLPAAPSDRPIALTAEWTDETLAICVEGPGREEATEGEEAAIARMVLEALLDEVAIEAGNDGGLRVRLGKQRSAG